MSESAPASAGQSQPYRARTDKSGLLIGCTVCFVIVLPMLIHLGKMAFGVAG